MKTDDKSAEAAVMITKNGTYTIYAEDEQGNKTVNVITITAIVTPDPAPDDTTPPTITGVEDGKTYENEVTPRIEDENLASVTLTKDGNVVEDYQNGDTISENGTYVLTAVDEAGNQTVVQFVIDIEEDDNDNNNTNTNTNNNTNTDNTTDNDNNTDNNHVSGNNINNNSNNHQQNTINNSGRNNTSTSNSKLPYAGLRNILMIGIMITSVVAIFTYLKYKKYKM